MQLINLLFTFLTLLSLAATLPSTLTDPELEARNNVHALEDRCDWDHLWPKMTLNPLYPNWPYCHYANGDPSTCTLVNRMPDGNPCDHTSLYLYDNNCNQIGNSMVVPYGERFVLDSELPWTLVFDTVEGGGLGWWYAGRYYGGDGYPVHTNCYYTNSNDPYNPTCEMRWQCHW